MPRKTKEILVQKIDAVELRECSDSYEDCKYFMRDAGLCRVDGYACFSYHLDQLEQSSAKCTGLTRKELPESIWTG